MGLLLISHDLGLIARNTARLLVMYGGSVVERGPTAAVLQAAAHPYTRGLLAARPRLQPHAQGEVQRLPTIAGTVPELADLPPGCPFAGRCAWTLARCHAEHPPNVALAAAHSARCLRPEAMRGSP